MRNFNFKFKDLGVFQENIRDGMAKDLGLDVDMDTLDMIFNLIKGGVGITPEEIEIAEYEAVKVVLYGDISDCNYERIQKLLEAGNISGEQLADMVDEQRFIECDFEEMAFADLVSLLSNEIVSNPMLREMFVSLYSKKYCDVSQIVKSITKKGMAKNARKIGRLSNEEIAFCFYLLMDTNNASDWMGLDFEVFSILKAVAHYGEVNLTSDYEDAVERMQALTFSETEDSVLQSKQFDKFLTRRRKELAEYLGVEEGEIVEALAEDMVFFNNVEEKYNQPKLAKYISNQVLIENSGGLYWLGDFAGSGLGMDHCYKPDIDRTIRSYYTVQVSAMYVHIINDTGKFTKSDLAKGWEANPERDVQGICYMYCLDVFCNMFNEMMKEYYKAFFEGKFAPSDTSQKSQMLDTINEQNLVIEEQKEQIVSLEKEIALLKEQSIKNKHMEKESEKVLLECERKNQKLKRQIEKCDGDIAHLKGFIESQNEFLAMLNQTEEGEVGSVDMDMLQAKRYLFVGKVSEALPDLKKKFPGSIFMETETKDISNIYVDGIVFLTKFMSHAIFYKVRSSKIFNKIPSANCNTKNINRIYYDMGEQLKVG